MKAAQRDFLTHKYTDLVGARLHGRYCGATFNGTITEVRPCYGTDLEYTIKLDERIFLFGNYDDPREQLLLRLDQVETCDISNY